MKTKRRKGAPWFVTDADLPPTWQWQLPDFIATLRQMIKGTQFHKSEFRPCLFVDFLYWSNSPCLQCGSDGSDSKYSFDFQRVFRSIRLDNIKKHIRLCSKCIKTHVLNEFSAEELKILLLQVNQEWIQFVDLIVQELEQRSKDVAEHPWSKTEEDVRVVC